MRENKRDKAHCKLCGAEFCPTNIEDVRRHVTHLCVGASAFESAPATEAEGMEQRAHDALESYKIAVEFEKPWLESDVEELAVEFARAEVVRALEGEKVAAHWKEWAKSPEGQRCLSGNAEGEYLQNRLWWAFMACAAAIRKQIAEVKG